MSKEIVLKVRTKGKEKNMEQEIELSHQPGKTALDTMREGGVILPSLCNGLGKCGKCMVRFVGYVPLPTQADRALLSPQELREGYRLACTAKPAKSAVIETDFDFREQIRTITESVMQEAVPDEMEEEVCRETVIAVDIGTTTVAMHLVAAESGRRLDTYTCLNPQRVYGADVISRIRAGMDGKGEHLQALIREELGKGCRQLVQTAERLSFSAPEKMMISCNTVMGHIFMGYPLDGLGHSPFQPVSLKAEYTEWEGMEVCLVPGISAFVGGDIISGVYACGLCERNTESGDGWLFLDLGTNAEMVMGMDGHLTATAAAAGPAFEGRGRGGALGAERMEAMALLLDQGMMDETGLLREDCFEEGAEVKLSSGKKVRILQEDIRDIQMAKAAVRTGIDFMLRTMPEGSYEKIRHVYLAGGLGFYLSAETAARIGLIPGELAGRVQTVGNTSLAGAVSLAVNWQKHGKKEAEQLEIYGEQIEVFNLAETEGFEEIYIGYMNFPDFSEAD